MRMPRNLSGAELASALKTFGYEATRQTGSHLRLTTQTNGEHHVTVPLHDPLKVGTLSGILNGVAEHLNLSRNEVLQALFQ